MHYQPFYQQTEIVLKSLCKYINRMILNESSFCLLCSNVLNIVHRSDLMSIQSVHDAS